MYSIAIDFGGTKIKGAIVDAKGKIYTTCRIPTEADEGRERIISNLSKTIRFLSDSFEKDLKQKREAPAKKFTADLGAFMQRLKLNRDIRLPQIRLPKELATLQLKKSDVDAIFRAFEPRILGVGISMPGFTDKSGKVIFGGGTLTSLVGMNLKKELESRTKFPVFIENDANCFALAEAVHGAGKRHNIVLGVIWGTGIGGGLVIDKRIYSGAFKDGLEFGHMVIDPSIKSGARCGCGQYGCLEMLASGKNITRRYYENGGKMKNAGPKEIYLSREPAAKKAIADAIHYLGIGLADLVDAFNPEIIVMGGSVSRFPNSAYGRLKKEVKKYALPMLAKNLRIVRYKISADEGILGAAEVVRYSMQPRLDEAAYEFGKCIRSAKTSDDFRRILREKAPFFHKISFKYL